MKWARSSRPSAWGAAGLPDQSPFRKKAELDVANAEVPPKNSSFRAEKQISARVLRHDHGRYLLPGPPVPQMVRIRQQILQIAPVDVPCVHLRGRAASAREVGSRRMIHMRSTRRSQAFHQGQFAPRCPENLLESELFGFEQGAFTGGRSFPKPGKFELANKGNHLPRRNCGDESPSAGQVAPRSPRTTSTHDSGAAV